MTDIIISAEIVAGVYTLLILAAVLYQRRIIRSKRGRAYIWFVAAVGQVCFLMRPVIFLKAPGLIGL